jgi:hypothetical protein
MEFCAYSPLRLQSVDTDDVGVLILWQDKMEHLKVMGRNLWGRACLLSGLSNSCQRFSVWSQSDLNSNHEGRAITLPSPSQVLHYHRTQVNSRTWRARKRLAWQNLIFWHNMMPGEGVFSLQSEKVNVDIKFWEMYTQHGIVTSWTLD